MKKLSKTVRIFAISWFVIAITMSLSGCVKTTKLVGYTMEDLKTDKLVVGKTRKAVVKRELGSPSSISTYGGETWYYISTEYESVAFLKPEVKEQKILAIEFSENQTIKTIKKYNESDVRDISLSSEITKSSGGDVGILGQLLGNVGRFNSSPRDVARPNRP